MATDFMTLYTFKLGDGRRVTYAGVTEPQARRLAEEYHPGTLPIPEGVVAERCACRNAPALPHSTRQNGWLICARCGGFFG
jgi:hypothetical protein